ncbi:abc transporter family protein [Stylonychia lemnae]|uniref:Abc transporter family protein n=1 Tax=Stylonychia lemnae TaxID=5949 RepID=A0A078B3C5_STYLE|nr:abc transporter family protein [Stylonychia lemnae]|eukprot:CDW88003.1 abc transporter family protein [Stylonychia lemnae]
MSQDPDNEYKHPLISEGNQYQLNQFQTDNNTHYSSFHERDTERFKDAKSHHTYHRDDDNNRDQDGKGALDADLLDQLVNQSKQRIEATKIEKQTAKDQVPYSKLLLTYADRTDKILMSLGFLFAFCTGAGMPSLVFLFGDIVNVFQDGNDHSVVDAIKTTVITLAVIGVVIWAASYMYFVFLVAMSERIGKKTRVNYLQGILSQDIAWFDSINVPELSARLSKECQAMQRALGEKIGAILMSIGMCLAGLFFAFFRGWIFSLILLAAFPIVMILLGTTGKAMQNGFKQNLQSYGQSAGYADQALNAIKVVQAFGQELTEIRNYDKYLGRARKMGIKTHATGAISISVLLFVIFGYYGYAFYTGSWLVQKEYNNTRSDAPYNAGDIMSCFFGVVFGLMSIGMATPNVKAIAEGKVAGKMAFDIIDRVPRIRMDDPSYEKVGDLKGQIEFRNVTFTYPSRPEQKVLDNFSAVFEEGKTTAIVGASDSGKSTIIQMIERFYDPDQGSVIVDGRNLKNLNLREFRHKVGYVSQEPVLFNTSIKANLLYCKPDATDDEVIQALKSANAYNFINEKMGKDGIYTNVGNAGGQLSGGQKQRIAIARAFIKKPKILLLDEATSALDKRNEREVQAAIDRIRQELGSITTIVIAHRLSTIKDADNIIVMSKGKITEEGTHQTLLINYPEGTYAKFVKEQEQSEAQDPSNQFAEEEIQEDNINSKLELVKGQSNLRKSTLKRRDLELDKVELQMKDQQDQIDNQKQQELEAIKKKNNQSNNFKRLMTMSYPKFNIAVGLFSSLGQGSLMPLFAIVLMKQLFAMNMYPGHGADAVRSDSDYYCMLILVISILSFLFGLIGKFSFGLIGENVTLRIRQLLYSRILQKSIGWFDEKENSPGVISASMASDAQTINGASAEGLAVMIQSGFSVLAGIIIGFIYNWREAAVCIGCVPFTMIGGAMTIKLQKGLSEDSDAASGDANLLAGDAILNYRTVASFGYETQIVKDYDQLLQGPVNVAIKKSHSIGFFFGFSQFVQYGTPSLLYYTGALFIDNGYTSFQDADKIFTAIFAMMMGAMAAGQAQQFGPDMGKAKQAAQKIFGVIDIPSEINAVEQTDNPQLKSVDYNNFKGEIEFKDGLNLKINAKETVALVGESGCGKSTTVSLLMRFYDVNFGQILIDGVDIKQYKLNELRRAMGLVMQEPTLFNYTISENILYGSSNATNSEIYHSAEIANALEFIESKTISNAFDDKAEILLRELKRNETMLRSKLGDKEYSDLAEQLAEIQKEEEKKGVFQSQEGDIDQRSQELKDQNLHQGFNVDCGLKGCKLSGGQKQRIAIARAIIRKPKMLILDEATSALDEASQRKVQVALDNIMKDRTSIVIAHRLSTVEKCDRILVLESGRLVEEGGFQELKQKDGGIFAQLASGMQNNANNQTK